MSIYQSLIEDQVHDLHIHDLIDVSPTTPIREVISILQKANRGCVLVTEAKSLVGIFTERDILMRIIGEDVKLDSPVSQFMTPNPLTIKKDESLASVIKKMREGGYRHLPVVNEDGVPVGILSVKHIVHYLVEYFPGEVYNLPPDPDLLPSSREGA